MREALSGTSSQCFTVSPALISIFGGFVGVGCVCFGVLVVCVGLCLCLFVFPPRVRSLELCAKSMQYAILNRRSCHGVYGMG